MSQPGSNIKNPTAGAAGRRQTVDRFTIGAGNEEDCGEKKETLYGASLL